MSVLKEFIVGFVLGIANIVPGVSGGTFALILGVYERLLKVLNNFGPGMVKEFFSIFSPTSKVDSLMDRLGKFLLKYDLWFAGRIGLGAFLAVALLSAVMKYCLKYQFEATYGFFFGLIVVSVFIPARLVKKYRISHLLPFLIGAVVTVAVAANVNPADKEKAGQQQLAEAYRVQQLENADQTESLIVESDSEGTSQSSLNKISLAAYGYIFFCGMIAISAMVLPGISGSLVLLLMGQYFAIIAALSGAIRHFRVEDILFLTVFGLGLAIGILIFARVIEFVFKRYHDGTVAMLVGLIVGSLYTLWPFKEADVIDFYTRKGNVIVVETGRVIHSNVNIWPEDASLALPAICCLTGGVIMLFFLKQPMNAVMTSEESA